MSAHGHHSHLQPTPAALAPRPRPRPPGPHRRRRPAAHRRARRPRRTPGLSPLPARRAPQHDAVAEQIGTLDAMHPGRFDLGLGRAPGGDAWTTSAIRRRSDGRDFAAQLAELLSYRHGTDRQVRAGPGEGARVPIHLLGSGVRSAALAAHLGLPCTFAAHFAPARLDEAMDLKSGAGPIFYRRDISGRRLTGVR
ncbi:LLM class flavin-dependent oxidoreductase [Streptomyces sp. NPDC000878]